jgi:carboxymethylenebutenolidase
MKIGIIRAAVASLLGGMTMAEAREAKNPDLGTVFDAHVRNEFVTKDVNATMETMTDDPYVHHVPTLVGGYGRKDVVDFYTNHFIGRTPADMRVEPISRTVSEDQVVDELMLYFTHDSPVDFILPGVPPTGKKVAVPNVVVMKFKDGKIAHEHIYWDQASVLAQIGLLDPRKLPISGVEQASRLLELEKTRE